MSQPHNQQYKRYGSWILRAGDPSARRPLTLLSLLRRLQRGEKLSLPQSRPMPSIEPHSHELRIADRDRIWRIVYRIDPDAIVVGDVFLKKTETTPKKVVDACKSRFRMYDDAGK